MNARSVPVTVIRRLQPELAQVAGITLFMQAVQDITVEDRVSRTQFQYSLEDPSAEELNIYAPRMLEKLKQLPELRDVASDQQVGGLRAKVVFDRETAYRLGITPSAIDQTLYDAYGQRQVSTIYTQLNQYHVVLEVKPDFQKNPLNLRDLYIRTGTSASSGLVSGGSGGTPIARTLEFLNRCDGEPIFDVFIRRFVHHCLKQRLRRGTDCVDLRISERRPGPTRCIHACGADERPNYRKPSRPISRGDPLLQSGAERIVRRSHQGHQQSEG